MGNGLELRNLNIEISANVRSLTLATIMHKGFMLEVFRNAGMNRRLALSSLFSFVLFVPFSGLDTSSSSQATRRRKIG